MVTATVNPNFGAALAAAAAATAGQQHPGGALYVVATPIGNLADVSLRALALLGQADTLACEDTRHSRALLRAWDIEPAGLSYLSVHEHNEAEAAAEVIERLRAGQRVAYVSDAGTPAISDPGARLVAAVRAAGLRVVPLPGASSVTAALSAAGVAAGGAFVFLGFLPPKAGERAAALQALAAEPRTVVLLEAPHRMLALAQGLQPLGERLVTLARELTKQFEEIVTLPAQQVSDWLAADAYRVRGEFVVVLHPAPTPADEGLTEPLRVLRLLLAELPLKTAVRLAADITGASRNALYERALAEKAAKD